MLGLSVFCFLFFFPRFFLNTRNTWTQWAASSSGFAQNLPQLPDWPLVQALEPPLRLPDGIFSVCLICVAAKTAFGRITASAATTASGERTKESSAIVTLALYNLQVSMRCDITNKRPPKQRKKKILPSRHPSVICENVHLWGSGANAWMASIQRQASNLQSLSSSENSLNQQKTPVWIFCVGRHVWIVIKSYNPKFNT